MISLTCEILKSNSTDAETRMVTTKGWGRRDEEKNRKWLVTVRMNK
jgi:hypothetical protein